MSLSKIIPAQTLEERGIYDGMPAGEALPLLDPEDQLAVLLHFIPAPKRSALLKHFEEKVFPTLMALSTPEDLRVLYLMLSCKRNTHSKMLRVALEEEATREIQNGSSNPTPHIVNGFLTTKYNEPDLVTLAFFIRQAVLQGYKKYYGVGHVYLTELEANLIQEQLEAIKKCI